MIVTSTISHDSSCLAIDFEAVFQKKIENICLFMNLVSFWKFIFKTFHVPKTELDQILGKISLPLIKLQVKCMSKHNFKFQKLFLKTISKAHWFKFQLNPWPTLVKYIGRLDGTKLKYQEAHDLASIKCVL